MAAIESEPHIIRQLANSQPMTVDYRTRGRTGLKLIGGLVMEDSLRQLNGRRGLEVYKEMRDDAVLSTVVYTIDKIVRQVAWRTERASDHPNDRAAADFLESCLDDLDTTFIDLISEVMTMLECGFSLHEIVYKKRGGTTDDGWLNSKYKDGRIGWRGMPIRAQETVSRWIVDDLSNVVAAEQCAPPYNQFVTIPMEKLLLFRTSTHKSNPEGRSIFRSAYRSWFIKKNIESIESIGIERDLAGLPMAIVPPEVMAQATAEDREMFARIEKIVTNIRRDEQEGIIFPSLRDDQGNLLYELKLLSSGGSRQFDTDKIISRYDSRMAMCALADFLLLGQNASGQGSWAMHSDKTKLFLQSVGAYLDIIQETFNRFAIPRLFRLNSFKITDYPRLVHDKVEQVDLASIGDFLQKICGAGAAIFPNQAIEERLCEIAGLPPLVPPEKDLPAEEPLGEPQAKDVQELHDGDPEPEASSDGIAARQQPWGTNVVNKRHAYPVKIIKAPPRT